MCPLCITAGTLYLAGIGTGSAGGLAAVATKVMRERRERRRQKPKDKTGSVVSPLGTASGHPTSVAG